MGKYSDRSFEVQKESVRHPDSYQTLFGSVFGGEADYFCPPPKLVGKCWGGDNLQTMMFASLVVLFFPLRT